MPKIRMAEGSTPEGGGKENVCGVRCAYEAGSGTFEIGKISHCRGEMLSEGMVVHPGNREKRRMPVVGCACEAGSGTPEAGESKLLQR